MFTRLRLTEEEKNHRRQMTNIAVKLMLLAVGAALTVQIVYYFAVIARASSITNWEFPLQVPVTVGALGWRLQFNQTRLSQTKQTPLELLKERYARGEISRKEYEQMRQDLEG